MALVVEAVGEAGVVERFAIEDGAALIGARPGMTYRIVDESGGPLDANATVRRVGDSLVIEGLPEEATVRLTDFFLACTPNAPCSLDLEGLGGARGETINQLSEPVAALADGSFVLHAPPTMATPTAPDAEFSAKPALAGLALLALAGGGSGGGGGGGSDGPPPGVPTITSPALTNDPTPVITGTATPGSQVTLTLTPPGSGPFSFVTHADGDGNWVIDTGAQAPAAGTMPPGGLPGDAITTGLLLAQTSGGTSGDPVSFQIAVDLAPPTAVATLVAVTDDVAAATGALPDGGVTNDPTPTLSGTLSQALDTGEVIRVLRDGVPIGTATATGTQWVFTDAGLADGATHVYSVRVEDGAGNASAPSADFTLTADFTAPAMPTIAGPIAGDNIVNEAEGRIADPSPVTVAGTAEPASLVRVVWGVETIDTTAAADGAWSALFNAQQIPDGDYAVSATAIDAAGNASQAASVAVRVLTGKPSAPSFLPVEGDNLVSAAEGVDGITLAGGMTAGSTVFVTIDGVEYQAAGNGNQWRLDLPAGTLGDGTYTATAIARDIAGNQSVAGSSGPFVVDVTPPTQVVTITGAVDNVAEGTGTIGNGGLTNDDTPLIEGTVSGGLSPGEVVQVFRGGVLVGTATASVTTCSFADNLSGVQGSHGYTARVVDAAGNEGAMSAGFSLVLDTQRPTVPTIGAVAADDFIDAAEATGGITITGGGVESGGAVQVSWAGITRTGIVDGAGNWSANFGPGDIPGDGIYDIGVRAFDAAGNGSLVQTRQVQVDRSGPSVTIASEASGPVNGAVTFTFTFTEPVNGFTASDVQLSAGSPGAFTGGDGDLVYRLVVTPPDGVAGSFTVDVPAGVAQDTAGNGNTAATGLTQQFDREAPRPTIEVPGGTVAGPFPVTISFLEAVTGFSAGDVQVEGGTAAGSFSGGNGTTTFVLQVTPASDTTGSVSISVPAGVATDTAGNPNLEATPQAQPFDTATAPGVTIASDASGTTNEDVTFTFTFTEPVNGFTAGDVQLSAGTKGAFTGDDGDSVYRLVVTPPDGAAGSFTVEVPAGVAQDAAGNGNTAAAGLTQQFDREAPTLTVADQTPDAIASGPVTFTFSFSEPVFDFDSADVDVAGGTKGAFSGNPGDQAYTLVVDPAPDSSGTISVRVEENVATDAAGNGNERGAPYPSEQAYDTSRTLAISELLDDVGAETGAVPSGESADDPTPTLTITLSGGGLQGGESILLLRDGVEVDSANSAGASWSLEDALGADGTYTYTAQLVSGGAAIETSAPWIYTLQSAP